MTYQGKDKPLHALSGVSGVPDIVCGTAQSVEYSDFSKIKKIVQGTKSHRLAYGADHQRIKGVFTKLKETITRYYLGNYEEEHKVDGTIRKLHFIA